MINKGTLHRIIDTVQKGEQILPGEIMILREAVDLLDDLSMTLDSIMKGSANAIMRGQARFEASTTQSFRIIEDDRHGGNRP